MEKETNAYFSEETNAYYKGRGAVWQSLACGDKIENPYTDAVLRASFARGVRHAAAEERLSNDFEWDDIR